MQHVNPERLVLLALSEDQQDLGEADHLDGCAGCRRDLEVLRNVADLGARSQDLRDLPPPPDRVWRSIEAHLPSASAPTRPSAPATRHAVPTGRPRRGRPRWMMPMVAAAAAAVLAVAGTVTVERFLQRPAAEAVTARATLAPLPTVPGSAGGSVRVLSDGRMLIDVRNLPLTPGFHQVWLLNPDDPTRMIAIGTLPDRSDVVLPVPPGTDLNRYRLVDVSDEPADGDVTHSGASLLRGTLTS